MYTQATVKDLSDIQLHFYITSLKVTIQTLDNIVIEAFEVAENVRSLTSDIIES